MRIARPALLLFASFLIPAVSNAQQVSIPAPRDAQSVLLLQRSLAALVGMNTVKDVTLTANVRRVAGSDDESGMATLEATSIGQARIDLSLASGRRGEVADLSTGSLAGSWSGSDGTWHPAAMHNLLTDPSWFIPAFFMARALVAANYAVIPADAQTKDGIAVEHFAVYQQAQGPSAQLIESLSRMDIYLDSSTFLPVAIAFNIHPDNDALTDIPIEVKLSNYQNSQGILVPYHIQKYIQNGLALDVAVTSVQVNSGLSATDFQAQ